MIKKIPLHTLKYYSALTVILLVVILMYQELLPVAFASPFFNRQEITNARDEWSLTKSSSGSVYDTLDGGRILVKYADNAEECKNDDGHYPFPSIAAVSYLSDGNMLNATVWLSDKFYDPILHKKPFLASSFKDLLLLNMDYTMSIDVNSVYKQGTAYYLSIKWNVINQTWTRMVEEGSSTREKRIIEKEENFTGFYDKGKSYVTFYLDLKKIGSPDQYNFILSNHVVLIKNNRKCDLLEISNVAQAPPPEFVISTNPNTVVLRPGEQTIIEMKIKSTTDYKSNVIVSTSKNSSLQLDFISNSSYVPPLGEITLPIRIKALDNTIPRTYTVPVAAQFIFPTEVISRGGDSVNNSASPSIIDTSNFVVTVQPPLTLDDRFNNFWAVYGSALSVIIPIIVPAFGTFVAHRLIKKHRKKTSSMRTQNKTEVKNHSSRMPV